MSTPGPCRALFVAGNSESISPYSRQSGSYYFVCGCSGSFNAAVIAGIRARSQSGLPAGPMDHHRLVAAPVCAHAHEHRPIVAADDCIDSLDFRSCISWLDHSTGADHRSRAFQLTPWWRCHFHFHNTDPITTQDTINQA